MSRVSPTSQEWKHSPSTQRVTQGCRLEGQEEDKSYGGEGFYSGHRNGGNIHKPGLKRKAQSFVQQIFNHNMLCKYYTGAWAWEVLQRTRHIKSLPSTYIYIKTCRPMLIEALSSIVQNWKKPRWPSTGKWINKLWYISTVTQ